MNELAQSTGLEFVIGDFQPYDVVNADEAWLTTTPCCVAPCTKINTTPIGTGRPGPKFKQMLQAWSQRVGMDIEAQVLQAAM